MLRSDIYPGDVSLWLLLCLLWLILLLLLLKILVKHLPVLWWSGHRALTAITSVGVLHVVMVLSYVNRVT